MRLQNRGHNEVKDMISKDKLMPSFTEIVAAALDGQQKNLHEVMNELFVDGRAHALISDDGTIRHIPNSDVISTEQSTEDE